MQRAGSPAQISYSPVDWSRTALAPTTLPRPMRSTPCLHSTLAPVAQDDIVFDLDALEGGLGCRQVDICPAQADAGIDLHPVADGGVGVDHHAKAAVRQLQVAADAHRERDLHAEQLEGVVSQAPDEGPGAGIDEGGCQVAGIGVSIGVHYATGWEAGEGIYRKNRTNYADSLDTERMFG